MCALRLECFTNDNPISSKTISLFEGFESEKDIAFSKGVKSGAEAASKAFETEKIRSLAPILEALNDIGFSQTEARHAALNSLRPLVSAVIQTALPACANMGFATEVTSKVMEIVERLPDAKITVFVPEDCVASVTQMLSPCKTLHDVVADDTLGPLEAKIDLGSGFDQIDISTIIAEIDQAAQSFFTSHNGHLMAENQNV